ncbi:MAG: phosphatidate cytidylyltransferase [Minicystis sp.]
MSTFARLAIFGAGVIALLLISSLLRRDRETLVRSRTLAAMFAALVLVIFLGKWAVALLCAVAARLCFDELGNLRPERRRAVAAIGWVVGAALLTVPLAPPGVIAPGLAALSAIAFVAVHLGLRRPAPISGASLAALGLHVACGLAATIAVTAAGSEMLLALLLLLQLNDGFAYLGGRAFGRTKLAPTISPKKSVEGAVFGAAAAGGFVLVLRTSLIPAFAGGSIVHALGVAAIVVVFGVAGDLTYSLAKRRANLKDFEARLPGHGGLLDRIDSLLAVLPLVLPLIVALAGSAP